jgi:HK97 family phage major capsid protein
MRYLDSSDERGPHLMGWYARLLAIRDKDGREGVEAWADTTPGLPQRIRRLVKAPVAGATLTDPQWAGYLADLDAVFADFSDALKTASWVYRLRSDAAWSPVPIGSKAVTVAVSITAALNNEGAAIPLGKMQFDSEYLQRRRAGVIVAVSEDLVRDSGAQSQSLLNRALQAACSTEIDKDVLELLLSTGAAGVTSSGDDVASVWADLQSMVAATRLHDRAKLYFLAPPNLVGKLATMATDGAAAFPTVSLAGTSELLGVPLLPTDAVEDDEVILVDAAAVAADVRDAKLTPAREASLDMRDDPTSDASTGTGSSHVSLWQSNMLGWRAISEWGATVIRDPAAVRLTGVSWGGSTA